MKTGLLLLQSISSSSLRCAARRSSSSSVHHLHVEYDSSSSARGIALFAAAGAFGGSAFGLSDVDGNGYRVWTGMAMCVGGGGDGGGDADVASTTSSKRPRVDDDGRRRRSIIDPEKIEHDPRLPFPECSLRHDSYDGVTLDVTTLTSCEVHGPHMTDAAAFGTMLGRALEIWTSSNRRGIWLKIPTSHSHLIAPACSLHGFDFQHAECGHCILTKWLPKNTMSRLPLGPTHQVGIGALVLHPTSGRMLAVRERSGPAAAAKLWKMPTGLTDPGEDIASAAIRELKEETGLDCVFDKM